MLTIERFRTELIAVAKHFATALHEAACFNRIECARVILEVISEMPEQKDEFLNAILKTSTECLIADCTAVGVAAFYGHVEVLRLLLEAGASALSFRSAAEPQSAMFAIYGGSVAALEMILSLDAAARDTFQATLEASDNDAIAYAAAYGHTDMFHHLLRTHPSPSYAARLPVFFSTLGLTPAYGPHVRGMLECARLVCDNPDQFPGAVTAFSEPSRLAPTSPLERACGNAHGPLVSFFLARGARPTPAHLWAALIRPASAAAGSAAERDHTRLVLSLIEGLAGGAGTFARCGRLTPAAPTSGASTDADACAATDAATTTEADAGAGANADMLAARAAVTAVLRAPPPSMYADANAPAPPTIFWAAAARGRFALVHALLDLGIAAPPATDTAANAVADAGTGAGLLPLFAAADSGRHLRALAGTSRKQYRPPLGFLEALARSGCAADSMAFPQSQIAPCLWPALLTREYPQVQAYSDVQTRPQSAAAVGVSVAEDATNAAAEADDPYTVVSAAASPATRAAAAVAVACAVTARNGHGPQEVAAAEALVVATVTAACGPIGLEYTTAIAAAAAEETRASRTMTAPGGAGAGPGSSLEALWVMGSGSSGEPSVNVQRALLAARTLAVFAEHAAVVAPVARVAATVGAIQEAAAAAVKVQAAPLVQLLGRVLQAPPLLSPIASSAYAVGLLRDLRRWGDSRSKSAKSLQPYQFNTAEATLVAVLDAVPPPPGVAPGARPLSALAVDVGAMLVDNPPPFAAPFLTAAVLRLLDVSGAEQVRVRGGTATRSLSGKDVLILLRSALALNQGLAADVPAGVAAASELRVLLAWDRSHTAAVGAADAEGTLAREQASLSFAAMLGHREDATPTEARALRRFTEADAYESTGAADGMGGAAAALLAHGVGYWIAVRAPADESEDDDHGGGDYYDDGYGGDDSDVVDENEEDKEDDSRPVLRQTLLHCVVLHAPDSVTAVLRAALEGEKRREAFAAALAH
jgi:hypothetical protein